MFEVELGKNYRSKVTGFVGMATAETRYIGPGHSNVLLMPRVDAEGNARQPEWVESCVLEPADSKPALNIKGDLRIAPERKCGTVTSLNPL